MLCSNVVSRFNSNNTSPPPCDGTRQSGRSSRQVFLFLFAWSAVPWFGGLNLPKSRRHPGRYRCRLALLHGFDSFSRNLPRHFIHSMCAISFSFLFSPAGNATDIENHWLVVFRRFYLNHSLGACCIICAIAIKNTGRHFARDFLLVTPSLYRIEYLTSTFFCLIWFVFFGRTKRNPC